MASIKSKQTFIRELNSRERRRLNIYNLIPVDAIDPTCTTRELIENNAAHLYLYGTKNVRHMNLEISLRTDSTKQKMKKKNLIFHLQGFIPSSSFSSAHQFSFT